MTRRTAVTHEFVQFVPREMKEGTVYVSIEYATAAHLCACGCGNKVVTPFTPTDWKLIFDGETISLDPSIGNWSFKCRSHYWIQRNRVEWARYWSDEQIAAGRERDRQAKKQYFEPVPPPSVSSPEPSNSDRPKEPDSIWARLRRFFRP
ncbi:DUF6527 family protein [Archangium gephyra]|uniref:DUF6527 family protein n=1 Tax=Archangium gephyra TaxID=48 RepID=UPI0035D46699